MTNRLLRNILLWILPAALLWLAAGGFYNRVLRIGATHLLHLTESPNVTDLFPYPEDLNYVTVHRRDFPPARSQVSSLRVTDLHYPLILLLALFLAPPGIAWRRRLENLGWALLVAIGFHLLLFVFTVKFVYATQLGNWSLAHYGPFARNFWGLGKHLLDLPIKLALPLALWAFFYLPLLRKPV
jgi:hypothetical protein